MHLVYVFLVHCLTRAPRLRAFARRADLASQKNIRAVLDFDEVHSADQMLVLLWRRRAFSRRLPSSALRCQTPVFYEFCEWPCFSVCSCGLIMRLRAVPNLQNAHAPGSASLEHLSVLAQSCFSGAPRSITDERAELDMMCCGPGRAYSSLMACLMLVIHVPCWCCAVPALSSSIVCRPASTEHVIHVPCLYCACTQLQY